MLRKPLAPIEDDTEDAPWRVMGTPQFDATDGVYNPPPSARVLALHGQIGELWRPFEDLCHGGAHLSQSFLPP